MPPRSNLSCEIRIISAENVELDRKQRLKSGSVFVRMHLSAGDSNGKVQLNTRELPLANGAIKWDQSFSLECSATEDSVDRLKRGSVALELRWRPTSAFGRWGGHSSSKLLGRAELPWGPAFSSPQSQIEAWVPLSESNCSEKSKLESASLLVAMTVDVRADASSAVECRRRRRGEEERCGCCEDGCGNSCQDNYELFVMAAALEAF